MPRKATLFIDLDNTLLECSRHYIETVTEAGKYIEAISGIAAVDAEKLFRSIDGTAMRRDGGFSRERFPKSMSVTGMVVRELVHPKMLTPEFENKLFDIGNSVFDCEYAVYAGVRDTLTALRAAGYQLVLCTKGDEEVQWWKIQKHNLKPYFDRIYVTPSKGVDKVQQWVKDVHADISDSWAIGDSLKDDIHPANAIGLKTILIHDPSNATYAWEDQDAQPDYVVNHFADVGDTLAYGVPI